jgi:HEAT repeat protein
LAFVGHPATFVRESIYRALKALRNGEALEPALKALRDPEPSVRVQAVGVIGYLKLEETLPALKHAASDDDANVRRVAVNALVFSRSPAAANTIAIALGDEDWSVREAAAGALALSSAGSAHSDGLIKVLDDRFWQVRLSAIRSLGKLEVRHSASSIVRELGNAQPNVRKEAAAALGASKELSSREALLAAADDPDADVRKNVRWALQELERVQ